jgi:hypothetical protein
MSVGSVDGGCSRHSSFCHLDNFHHTPLLVPPKDPFVGTNRIRRIGRKGIFVHLRLLCVGRIARMFTLRWNCLFVLETSDIINPLSEVV